MIAAVANGAVVCLFTHDLIQQDVKQETSLLGERRSAVNPKTGEERPLYEQLVMDEEYDYLFRRLFNEAQSVVLAAIPGRYLKGTPTDFKPLLEHREYDNNKDWILAIRPGENGMPMQYRKAWDSEVEGLLTDYITYRWLETKSPEDAQGYFVRVASRAETLKKLLAKGRQTARGRWGSVLP